MQSTIRSNLILAGIATLLVTAFAVFGYWPQNTRRNNLQSEIAKANVRIEESTVEAIRIPQLRNDVDRLRSEFHDFDRRLPRQQELAGFLTEISTTVQQNDLAEHTIEPGSPTSGDLYNRMPIIMNFSCDFTSLVNFLDTLSRMTRLTRVERINVAPTQAEGEDLRVRMQVNIYFTKS